MIRGVLGVIAGLVVANLLVLGFDLLGHVLYPIDNPEILQDPELLKEFMLNAPLGAQLAILAGNVLGMFGGVATTLTITKGKETASYIIGILFLLACIVNLMALPGETWYNYTTIAGVLGAYFMAYKMFRKTQLEEPQS